MRDDSRLLRLLADQNPWWDSGKVPSNLAPPFKRRDFFVLGKELAGARITAIAGPRQVGKTTLLYQLVEDLLGADVRDPKRVLFLAMDFPQLQTDSGDVLSEALETYSAQILAASWRDLGDTCYAFLDEVTKLPEWHQILKGWFDRKLPLKFVISDSSLSAIQRGVASSLVGRCDIQLVLPMKFVDVLMFHEGRQDINDVSLALRKGFAESVQKGSAEALVRVLRAASGQVAPYERKVLSRLQRYLFMDGYPELLETQDWAVAGRRLREYVDLIFARDLLRMFEIRNPRALNALVGLIADQNGSRFDYSTLARAVGLSPDAIREYLDYLESVFLVIKSEFWTKSRASRVRKQKKLYLGNVGLANGLTGNVGPQLLHDSSHLGRVTEALVADHAMRLLYALDPGKKPELHYWRNYRGQEVDMILGVGKHSIPVEVKYQGEISSADRRPLLDFLESDRSAPFGIIVSRGGLRLQGDILEVPLHLFLLMC